MVERTQDDSGRPRWAATLSTFQVIGTLVGMVVSSAVATFALLLVLLRPKVEVWVQAELESARPAIVAELDERFETRELASHRYQEIQASLLEINRQLGEMRRALMEKK